MFECKLDVYSCSLLPVLAESTPMGDIVVVDKVYNSCVIVIEDQELLLDLIVLDIQEFDVILGWTGYRRVIPNLIVSKRWEHSLSRKIIRLNHLESRSSLHLI